jgi:peptidoglycan/xylan/chitin deacetylase (PgdA/CDA1 family)
MAHSFLSKLNFALGRNPKIERNNDWRLFIPKPYSAVVLIQADFEMAWAWCWSKCYEGDIQSALEMARCERQNIPQILDICDRYKIPVTWATVGHLLLDNCQRKNDRVHQDIPQLPEFENEFWKFNGKDWFEHDPGTDGKRDPEWYAPDLIKNILARETKHEIGCHTFSHIDCRDGVCSPEIMRAELQKCKKLAKEWGIELKSFVHPGHTIGNLDVLIEEGFTNFRTDYRNVLGYPKDHGNGFWELQSTMEIGYRQEWSMEYHIQRYRKIIDRAIQSNTICCLWFHPSVERELIKGVMPELMRYVDQRRDEILISTTADYIEWLNK